MKNKFMKHRFNFCGVARLRSDRLPHGTAGGESDASRKFESRDEFKIEAAVYGYLLEKHPWDSGEYTAIFLEGSDDRVAALIRKFPNHVPPIKPSNRMQLHPNQTPIDKDTGKPAMILSAKAMDPTNGCVRSHRHLVRGRGGVGLYAFVLVKVDGEWTIQSAR